MTKTNDETGAYMAASEDIVPDEARAMQRECDRAAAKLDAGYADALESEEEYAARPVPHVAPSAQLEALSALWKYPENGASDTERALGALEEAVANGSAGKRRSAASLREAFSAYETSTETVVGADMVQLDYTRLFIGSFKMYAPPYASYYLDGADQVFGPTAVAVEELYAAFGLQASDEHDMPDHIRYLIAFLGLLAKSFEQTGSRDAALAYEDFKAEFVAPWIARFAENIHAYTEYPFYQQLIDVTRATL